MKFGLPVWHGNIESIESEIRRAYLLGFDYVEISLDYPWPETLSKSRIKKIVGLARDLGIGIAFHAPPEGVDIGSPFPETRKNSVKFLLFLVKWSKQFGPLYLNFHGSAGEQFSPSDDDLFLGAVLSATRRSAREISSGARKLRVPVTFENTPDPIFGISRNIDFILGSGVSLCLDIGHSEIINCVSKKVLGKEDRQYKKWAKLSGKRILTIHLHKVKRGSDHYPFSKKDRELGKGYGALARNSRAKFTTIEIMKEEHGAVHKVSDRTMKSCLEAARSWTGEEGEDPGKKFVYSVKREHLSFLRSSGRGKIVSGEIREADLPKGRRIIVVGDECSAKIPVSSVFSLFYDGKTRRRKVSSKKLERLSSFRLPEIRVENPRGKITKELWNASKTALAKRTKVFVKGEEDLATLAIIAIAPLGTVVVYGIPLKGSCILTIGKEERERARELIGEGVDYAIS